MVAHNVDGWKLADYDWDPETGIGTFTYERGRGVCVEKRAQPSETRHAGWYTGALKI